MNVYNYSFSDPVSHADPVGLWAGIDDVITGPVDEIIVLGLLYKALTKAKEECTTSPAETSPKDPCREIISEINRATSVIRQRIEENLIDKNNLFSKAYNSANLNLPPNAGTWVAHQAQIKGWQARLRKLIAKADMMGCLVPPEARRQAVRGLPNFPRGYQSGP